jgi:hypothetical protein
MSNVHSKPLSVLKSQWAWWQQRVVELGSFSGVMSWAVASGERQAIVADEMIVGTATR